MKKIIKELKEVLKDFEEDTIWYIETRLWSWELICYENEENIINLDEKEKKDRIKNILFKFSPEWIRENTSREQGYYYWLQSAINYIERMIDQKQK